MLQYPIAHLVGFTLPRARVSQNLEPSSLKALAMQIHDLLTKPEFNVSELFGAEPDVWGFSTEFPAFDINIGVSRDHKLGDDRWSIIIQLPDPGWFPGTRARRIADMKRVEWAVHDALSKGLGAANVEWQVHGGRADSKKTQSSP